MAGQVYLMPTADLTFTPTGNDAVPKSELSADQVTALNYLKNNGFTGHNYYTVDGNTTYPRYTMYKTGTKAYRAYYLKNNGNVAYLYLYTTSWWQYYVIEYTAYNYVTLRNSGQWSTDNVNVIRNTAWDIPTQAMNVSYYNSEADARTAISAYLPSPYPITYRLTNATTTGPSEANVGDTVTVPLMFPEGYGIVNPSSDVYVTCNGVSVPSTYSDGQLVFIMPDPS